MRGLKKISQIEHELAIYFIDIEINSKVDSIDKLMKKYNYGRGTIQNGLKELENSKSITLKKEGSKGTILVDKDMSKLYKHLNINFINGQLPMPYTKRYEGLASALNLYFSENYPFKYFTSFVRSSFDRIESVIEGSTDFAVVSYEFALVAINDEDSLEIGLVLPAKTYTSNHVIVSNKSEVKRVGIDLKSYDHQELILSNYEKDKYQFINLAYNLLERSMLDNKIDASIFNSDHELDDSLIISDEVKSIKVTQAAFVVRKDNDLIKKILPKSEGLEQVISHQKDVLNDITLPTY